MRVPVLVLVLSLLVAAPAPGRAAAPFLMPGLTEISAEPVDQGPARAPSEVGISYGLYLVGPFRGTAQVEVRRGKEVVAREKRARTLSLAERQTVRLGSGAIVDNRFGAPLPDLVFPGEPGDYTLAVVLSGRKALLHPFQIAPVKTIGGTGPGIPAADYLDRAALRLSPPYFDEPCRKTDILWMTLPADLRQERTRVDFLFYYSGVLQGRFFRDVPLGPLKGDHLRLKTLITVGGWMDTLSKEQVLSNDGTWEIHVIQDAHYLTTCTFSVEGGAFGGAGSGSRELACAPRRGGTVKEAQALAARVQGHRPAGPRAQEVMALHRSPKARELRRQLLDLAPGPKLSPAQKAKLARDYRQLMSEQGRGE